MKSYVDQNIRMCFECLITKVPGGKKPGLLHSIPPGKRPFQVVHVDHIGLFLRSSKKSLLILVLVDTD